MLSPLLLALGACSGAVAPPSPARDAAAEVPVTGCAACGERINEAAKPNEHTGGYPWYAWQYTPSCSFTATRLEIKGKTSKMAVLTDQAGRPGSILAETTSTSASTTPGWTAGAIPPVPLVTGKAVWIAIVTVGGLSTTDYLPTTDEGLKVPYAGLSSKTLTGGVWQLVSEPAGHIFGVRGSCP